MKIDFWSIQFRVFLFVFPLEFTICFKVRTFFLLEDTGQLSSTFFSLNLFNILDIPTWFVQLQDVLTARTTSKKTQFAYVVEKLPVEVACEILDLLNIGSEKNPYGMMRQNNIKPD